MMDKSVYVGIVYNEGRIVASDLSNTYGVRPVISLANGTLVTGEGTNTNPYVVE